MYSQSSVKKLRQHCSWEFLNMSRLLLRSTSNSAEYFMPCALPYATEEQCVPYSSPFWVIRFRKWGIVKEYIPPPVGYLSARDILYIAWWAWATSSLYSILPDEHELPQVCLIIHDCVLNAMYLTEEVLTNVAANTNKNVYVKVSLTRSILFSASVEMVGLAIYVLTIIGQKLLYVWRQTNLNA